MMQKALFSEQMQQLQEQIQQINSTFKEKEEEEGVEGEEAVQNTGNKVYKTLQTTKQVAFSEIEDNSQPTPSRPQIRRRLTNNLAPAINRNQRGVN